MKILAIDPGTKTMGYCVLEVDEDKMDIEITYAECHNADKMVHRYPNIAREYDDLTARLKAHEDNLRRLVTVLKPDLIAAESPFFNPKMPTSAEPLARMKQVITTVAVECQVDLEWIAPQQMKRAIGANVRNSSKDNVRDAIDTLLKEGLLHFSPTCEQQYLDEVVEHVVDAIGVGYSFAIRECLND